MIGNNVVCSLGFLFLIGMLGKAFPVVQKKPDTAPMVEPGFTSLFDGKTFIGWSVIRNKDIFKVNKLGEIEAGNSNDRGYLVNNGDYTDFVLRFRVKHVFKRDAKSLEKFKYGDGWGMGVLVRTKSTEMSGVLVTTFPSPNAYGFADR